MRHTTVGVLEFDRARATPGVTIITPLQGKATYLVGMKGEVLHQWDHPIKPGSYAYLLPSGNLLWAGETVEGPSPGGGKGGLLREYDWDGQVVWEYQDDAQHHDFCRLQNGNTLYIGWEKMPKEAQARMIGAEPGSEDDSGDTWSDYLREVSPAGETVWEWHAHTDMEIEEYPLHIMSTRKEFLHCNACTELPNGDIMLSFRKNSMIIVVDKKSKKVSKQWQDNAWGQQHDCTLLENGNVLFFANGIHVPGGIFYSKVIEFDWDSGDEVWSYTGWPLWSLFSPNISGAQRLASGNTLICEGLHGRIIEVTPEGEIVWEFVSPWFIKTPRGPDSSIFRAYRYTVNSPEIAGRVSYPE
ncbi:MAG: aryl-sulfate sulfotransferase [Rhodospirillales bacterium]|nr:aryl-sulfate sulfotransferase [Rhodospirillales bacterium]